MFDLIIKFILVIIMLVGLTMSYYPSLFISKKNDYGNPQKLKSIKRFGTILFLIMVIILFIVIK